MRVCAYVCTYAPHLILVLLFTVAFYLLALCSNSSYHTLFGPLVPVLNSLLATFPSYLNTVYLFSTHLSFVPIAWKLR
jgi:hypothetical protein